MFRILISILLLSSFTNAQVTTGGIQGRTIFHGKNLANVQIILSNTNNGFFQTTFSNDMGLFQLMNIIPDKNYSIRFFTSYTDSLQIDNIEVALGKIQTIDISLRASENLLQPVLVKSTINSFINNSSLQINSKQMNQIPSTGRDYTKLMGSFSQVFIKESANGAISFSGQNNRYNSLYIDGALQNDVFGLSANGMYGGQTGNVPVSLENIEQIQVQQSPYDASMGGYTGAAINMISKSGKNQPYSAIYRYMQTNNGLYNNTGLIMSGPIKLNRLFYYFNIDFLRSANEIQFDFAKYEGDTKNPAQFQQMVNSIKVNYGYDPGILADIDQTNAVKTLLKLDYLHSKKNRFTLSIRSQFSDKSTTGFSTNTNLFFSNNGKYYQHQHISGSLEWKHQWKKNSGNSLLISYTNAKDQTSFLGKPFPSVTMLDGNGLIFLGSNEDATESSTDQTNICLLEKFSFTQKKQFISTGVELELNAINNQFLQNKFGSYFYFSVIDYLQNKRPGAYEINFYNPNQQQTKLIQLFKTAFFINDKISIHKNIQLIGGIRITAQQLINSPIADSFTQDTLLPKLAHFNDLKKAEAGKKPNIPINISPRLHCYMQFPKQKTSIEIGTGVFSGRMPLAWLGEIYFNNGIANGSYEASPQQLNQIRFQQNIRQQWMPKQFGVTGNRAILNLTAANLNMPSVWRSAIQVTHQFKQQWLIQLEAMYYQNTHEIAFSNINLLPPTERLIGPDNRYSYRAINNATIPVLPDNSNPFTHVILMYNNDSKNGYGYRIGVQIKKETLFGDFTMNYAFGKSLANQDGNNSILLNQWRLNEHVNGRNNIDLAISDFSPGHRLNINYFKEWAINKKNNIHFSLVYNGYSGSRFSYVYGKKTSVRDDENSPGFELIYIPTTDELKDQYFQPLVVNNLYYTADQQKEALELFIENNDYLKNRRGNYAERNGISTPFVHRLDARISTYSNIQLNRKKYGLAFTLDVFNLTNLLNKNWGKTYFVPGNRLRIIDFVGFTDPNQLIPIYQFNPINLTKNPWEEQSSQNPHFSNNWTLQIGCRIIFY